MTPEQFMAWVGGGTALITALIKGLQMLLTTLGATPENRRSNQLARLASCEQEIEELKAELAVAEGEIERLRDRIKEERDRVATLEGLFMRLGWRKTPDGDWEPR